MLWLMDAMGTEKEQLLEKSPSLVSAESLNGTKSIPYEIQATLSQFSKDQRRFYGQVRFLHKTD